MAGCPLRPVLIVGQGLAGTALAWALYRAGREFFVVDAGHEASASRVGVGLVNPVTGERWASAPGWGERSAQARCFYRGMEEAWGVKLIADVKVRRNWRDDAEAAMVRERVAAGRLAPWVRPEGIVPDGAWIEGAWRLDLRALLGAGRRWLREAGRLEERVATTEEAEKHDGPVVWCVGAAEARERSLRPIGGETLELALPGDSAWDEATVRHDGHWVAQVGRTEDGASLLWLGASFVRDEAERSERRERLRTSARRQLADLTWTERAVLAGWRMTTADRRPLGGWRTGAVGRDGVLNGLGSKGALLTPGLAEEWVARLA